MFDGAHIYGDTDMPWTEAEARQIADIRRAIDELKASNTALFTIMGIRLDDRDSINDLQLDQQFTRRERESKDAKAQARLKAGWAAAFGAAATLAVAWLASKLHIGTGP